MTDQTITLVSIVMGSDSDLPVMKEALDALDEFSITHETLILSAHRSPDETAEYAKEAVQRGVRVVIAGAGGAAHLAGVIASLFTLPVIGVPMKTATLQGVDSLYSIVQMPPGVPVATVGINAARNAGILAVQILATGDPALEKKLQLFKQKLAEATTKKTARLRELGVHKYLEGTGK